MQCKKGMSALPPKADMCSATRDVRFVPKADIDTLFDHLVGSVSSVAGGDSEVGEVSTESRSVGFDVLTRLGLRVERTNTVRFANTIDPDNIGVASFRQCPLYPPKSRHSRLVV